MSTAEKLAVLQEKESNEVLTKDTVKVLKALQVDLKHAMRVTTSGKTMFKGLHDIRYNNERIGSIREYEDGTFLFIPVNRYHSYKIGHYTMNISLKQVAIFIEEIKKRYF